MKRIKLKDYTGEMVCAVSRFKGIKFLYTDQEEKIKTWKENGYTILGTVIVKVFDEKFIKCSLKEFFKDYATDYGFDKLEEKLDFDNEKYKKVEEAVREYINSLGDINNAYYYDTDTIIEGE